MRIPLSWLSDYVDLDVDADTLAELITNAGLEVTAVDRVGVPGAALEWAPETVRLAKLLQVERHPEADRLVLATVDLGGGETKQVVTGAPNLFPYLDRNDVADLDLMSPILLEGGTYLNPYKDGKPTKLKGKELRGIYNDAMLCSPVELGLGEDHDGILLAEASAFRADGVAPAPGTPLVDVLGDTVLEIDVIPNIARCASMLGVAREVAALRRTEMRPPSFEVKTEGPSFDGKLEIHTEQPELNPRFVAIFIEGVEQKPSPLWMQNRLRLAGQRPINAVVDVSNYVMLEVGQPNHTFDWDFLRRRADEYAGADQPVRIVTRLAEPGETLTTLDGTERTLPESTILVTDPAGNLSVGGIMGGHDSEITDGTTNVLLEAAAWNFINIRKSGRLLGLHTDAGFRFSRGVHPHQAMLGAKRAAELLRRVAGGTVAQGIVDYEPLPAEVVTIDLDPEMVNRRSGLALSSEEIAEHLRRLEFAVETTDNGLRVTVPDHRLDVEGPHDLLEEVCRMVGYENIPETVLRDSLPPQRGNPNLETEEQVRNLLAGAGFHEVITYRLTTPEAEAKVRAGAEPTDEAYVELSNPSTQDRAVMRHSLLASLAEPLESNLKHRDAVCLFEIGHTYHLDGKSPWGEALPSERPKLALVMTGPRTPEAWDGQPGTAWDFYDLKGVLDDLFAGLHTDAVAWSSADHPTFRPGRTASLDLDGSHLGTAGELHPAVVQQLSLRTEHAVLAAEIDLNVLLGAARPHFTVNPVPQFPAVREDLALLVPRDLPAGNVSQALLDAGRPLLIEARLFDVYDDEKLGDEKSLAYRLTFQAPNRTLKDKDVAKQRKRILRTLEGSIGAKLRS